MISHLKKLGINNIIEDSSGNAGAAIAALRLQKPGADHFTLWDMSAVLMLVALGTGMFSDVTAVEAYLLKKKIPMK